MNKLNIKSIVKPAGYLIPALLIAANASAQQTNTAQQTKSLPEIIVTADFRAGELQTIPASLTVMTEELIKARSAQHLEDIINLAPNVNFSSGSSRARFFQIRGIGERSQFSQPINPSVGFIIDGVDFSGIGTAATMFDVEQVEVLRGPQGTRYGANALAGLINIRTKAPTDSLEAAVEATVAEYDTYSLGAAVSGPLVKNKILARLAVQQYESDGFIDNTYLNRDDSNNRDEFTTRAKLRFLVSDDLTVDASLLHADIDNGFDAFSLDHDRKTRSDQPGHDRQRSTALGVDINWNVSEAFRVEGLLSLAESDLEYGYDEDWTYIGFHPDEYSSFDNYNRDRDNYSVELRLLSNEAGKLFNNSTDWVVGVYHLAKDEQLERQYTYLAQDFSSDYDTANSAIYGQLDIALSEKLTLITGLRFEQWQADYQDSNTLAIDSDENLWGGKLGLDYQLNDQQLVYGILSQGYKAGGVNTDGSLPDDQRDFETETMLILEGGLKSQWLDNRLYTQLSIFYAQRDDQQVKSSYMISRPDSSTEFVDYVENAAEGNNYGLEAELTWQATDQLQVFANLGLLETEFDEYFAPATQVDPGGLDLSGREQAHAPAYQFALGGRYDFSSGWFVRGEIEGKDSFYYSDRHNAQSDAYELLNMRLGYDATQWSAALWVRNLTDEDYTVRGFGSFGNDPRDGYTPGVYEQLGEPRVVGISLNWNL